MKVEDESIVLTYFHFIIVGVYFQTWVVYFLNI